MAKSKGTIRQRMEANDAANGSKPRTRNTAEQRPVLVGEPEQAPKVETYSAADLMKMELSEPRWAVPDILPEGLSVLAGKPKMGKSWLALNVAIAVATGGVALASFRVLAGAVLYLALEDNKRRLKARLEKLLQRQDAAPPDRLTFAHKWPRQDQGGLGELGQWLDAHKGTRLVIIDTWAKFKPARFRNGNDYDQDYREAAELKALADHYGVAILVLHHCRKMKADDPLEEVSGTMGLTGAFDGVLVLRRERGRHDAALHATGRDVEEQELALSWDAQHCLWSIAGQAAEYRMSKERADVQALFLREGRPLSPSEAAPLLRKNVGAVKNLFWNMEKAAQLRSVGGGRYDLPANHANRTNPANNADAVDQQGNGPVSGRAESADRGETLQTPWD
jgi:AAA domain-containing protein